MFKCCHTYANNGKRNGAQKILKWWKFHFWRCNGTFDFAPLPPSILNIPSHHLYYRRQRRRRRRRCYIITIGSGTLLAPPSWRRLGEDCIIVKWVKAEIKIKTKKECTIKLLWQDWTVDLLITSQIHYLYSVPFCEKLTEYSITILVTIWY